VHAGGWRRNFAFVSDVAVKPGTNGAVVDAVVGWRAGSNCNGFFESTDGGLTFNSVTVNGAINNTDLGRVTIAWSADATKMYAIVQSASMFNHPKTDGGGTLLQGVYSSNRASAAVEQDRRVAEPRQLGSALKTNSKGYHPGVQAWYNQFLGVDPRTQTTSSSASRRYSRPTTAAGAGTRPGLTGTLACPAPTTGWTAALRRRIRTSTPSPSATARCTSERRRVSTPVD
jgi:hypothetical protein